LRPVRFVPLVGGLAAD